MGWSDEVLRLPPFRYHRQGTVAQALGVMGEHAGDAMYVAGATDLITNMKHRLFEPGHLVALKGIHELGGIRVDDGHLRIGAAETLSSVATNPEAVSRFPSVDDSDCHRPRRGWHGVVDRRRYHRTRSATTCSHGLA